MKLMNYEEHMQASICTEYPHIYTRKQYINIKTLIAEYMPLLLLVS